MAMTEGVLLAELAEVLAQFGGLKCRPAVVSGEDGSVTLTLQVSVTGQSSERLALATLELFNALQHVQDIGQLRLLSARYGIDPVHLEQFVRKEDG